jgi:hypothetical protein
MAASAIGRSVRWLEWRKIMSKATPDLTKKADELTTQELEAVVGGRDAATGLATGKRQHKPITVS